MSEVEFLDKFDSRKPRKDDTDIVFYGLSAVKTAAAVEIAQKLGFQGLVENFALACLHSSFSGTGVLR